MRRLRPWPIVFLTVNLLFLIWLITGAVAAGHGHCDPQLSHQACTSAKEVGGTIGVALIVFFWAAVDFILLAVWAVFRFFNKKG